MNRRWVSCGIILHLHLQCDVRCAVCRPTLWLMVCVCFFQSKNRPHLRGEYNVYSTFQSHEPEFDYLKSLEIEEKINKIRWLPQQNAAHFLLSTNGRNLLSFCFQNLMITPGNCVMHFALHSYISLKMCFWPDKTIKLWKISERDKRAEGYNLKDEDGRLRDPFRITSLRVRSVRPFWTQQCFQEERDLIWRRIVLFQVPVLMPMDLMVEASPRRIFANAHTYHINSISVNSDHETYLSADDLRINLWHLEITDRSFSILPLQRVNLSVSMLNLLLLLVSWLLTNRARFSVAP